MILRPRCYDRCKYQVTILFLIIGGSAVTAGKFCSTTVGKPIHSYSKTFLSIKSLWGQFWKLVFL